MVVEAFGQHHLCLPKLVLPETEEWSCENGRKHAPVWMPGSEVARRAGAAPPIRCN